MSRIANPRAARAAPRPADCQSAKPQIPNLRYDWSAVRQSKTWRALLTICVLSAGLDLPALAQFAIPWHTIDGGGATSTGGVYRVSGTIGQPDAGGPMTGGNFILTGGFWALPQLVQTPGAPTLFITNAAPGWAALWWTPASGIQWVLQERLSLTAGAWTNSPSGATNPITVSAPLQGKFYRLFKA